MTAEPVPDDWWPEWLQDLASEDPLGSEPVVVAAIEATGAEHQRYRQLFTALAPVDTESRLAAPIRWTLAAPGTIHRAFGSRRAKLCPMALSPWSCLGGPAITSFYGPIKASS